MSAVGRYEPAGDLGEGRHFGLLPETRIQPLLRHPPILQRPVTRLVQRHDVSATQPEIRPQRATFAIALPLDRHPDDPAPRARRVHDQIEPVSVSMSAGPEILHQLLGQLPRQRLGSDHIL